MLELLGVSKRYGPTLVLAPITLTVEPGGTLVLLGSSGAGKSTLLRVINGLVVPDTGEVRVGGVRLEPRSLRELRHRMGYVIQEGGLFPHLSVADNVALAARDLGWSRDRQRARLLELVDLVRLPVDALGRSPAELSGGQRQRVSLMRALMLGPKVLLLDEPLAALDPILRVELRAELRALTRRLGVTTVLVTHDLADAACFGGEVALLHAGRLEQKGALGTLAREPATELVGAFMAAERESARLVAEAR